MCTGVEKKRPSGRFPAIYGVFISRESGQKKPKNDRFFCKRRLFFKNKKAGFAPATLLPQPTYICLAE
jgi:hypothetical protein